MGVARTQYVLRMSVHFPAWDRRTPVGGCPRGPFPHFCKQESHRDHFDFLPNSKEYSKRVAVASKWVPHNDFGSNFILSGHMETSAKTF